MPGRGLSRARGAFTLLELVIVIALVAMIAGLVLPAVGGWSRAGRAREAMLGLHGLLLTERVEAMRQASVRRVEVTMERQELVARVTDEEPRRWPVGAVTMRDARGREAEKLVAEFSATGRTTARRWVFEQAEGSRDASGTLWRIEFDPVSGAAEAVRGAAAGAGERGVKS